MSAHLCCDVKIAEQTGQSRKLVPMILSYTLYAKTQLRFDLQCPRKRPKGYPSSDTRGNSCVDRPGLHQTKLFTYLEMTKVHWLRLGIRRIFAYCVSLVCPRRTFGPCSWKLFGQRLSNWATDAEKRGVEALLFPHSLAVKQEKKKEKLCNSSVRLRSIL